MPAQRLARLLGVLTAVTALLPATAVHAEEPPLTTLAVLARAHVSYTPITGGWRVCGDGSFPASSIVAGAWGFTVAGARNGVPFAFPPQTGAGPVADFCEDVIRDSATGFVAASLTYTAAGSYVVAASVQGSTWEANTGTRRFGLDPRP